MRSIAEPDWSHTRSGFGIRAHDQQGRIPALFHSGQGSYSDRVVILEAILSQQASKTIVESSVSTGLFVSTGSFVSTVEKSCAAHVTANYVTSAI